MSPHSYNDWTEDERAKLEEQLTGPNSLDINWSGVNLDDGFSDELALDDDPSTETKIWILTSDGKQFAGTITEPGDIVFTAERLLETSTYCPEQFGQHSYFVTDMIDLIQTLERVTIQTYSPDAGQ